MSEQYTRHMEETLRRDGGAATNAVNRSELEEKASQMAWLELQQLQELQQPQDILSVHGVALELDPVTPGSVQSMLRMSSPGSNRHVETELDAKTLVREGKSAFQRRHSSSDSGRVSVRKEIRLSPHSLLSRGNIAVQRFKTENQCRVDDLNQSFSNWTNLGVDQTFSVDDSGGPKSDSFDVILNDPSSHSDRAVSGSFSNDHVGPMDLGALNVEEEGGNDGRVESSESKMKDGDNSDAGLGESELKEGEVLLEETDAVLNPSYAQPNMLENKLLAETMRHVMRAAGSQPLTRERFIQLADEVIDSGVAPPINFLLTGTYTQSGQSGNRKNLLPSEEEEKVKHCKPKPELKAKYVTDKLVQERYKLRQSGQQKVEDSLRQCK